MPHRAPAGPRGLEADGRLAEQARSARRRRQQGRRRDPGRGRWQRRNYDAV